MMLVKHKSVYEYTIIQQVALSLFIKLFYR